jgi:hypothetical protein
MVVAACGGGSDRLSASGYARAASGVCARANRAVTRISLPSFSLRHDASRSVTHIVVIQRRAIDDLRDLRPPGRLANTVQRWIALLDQAADELELTGSHLRAGRRGEAVAFGAKATTLLERARELVAPLRVTSCHGPELPTV